MSLCLSGWNFFGAKLSVPSFLVRLFKSLAIEDSRSLQQPLDVENRRQERRTKDFSQQPQFASHGL